MAGVEDVLGSPLSPRRHGELDAVPVTVPSSLGSWARGAKSCCSLALGNAHARSLPCQCEGCCPQPGQSCWRSWLQGTARNETSGASGQRELGTSPYLLPRPFQALRHCGQPRAAVGGGVGANLMHLFFCPGSRDS